MAGKLSGGANCVRAVFIIFNVLFSIVGAIVLALGIYLAVEGESYSFITGSEITSGAGLLIASGAITFCIAAIGFIGACFKLRPLLVVFAIVLILIVLLEIAAAIIGSVHYSQSDLESQYSESWQDALTDYRANPDSNGYQEDVNNAVDSLQEALECCGASEPSDWGVYNPDVLDDLNQMLPDSCNCTPGDDVMNCSTVQFLYSSGNMTRAINQVAWTVGCVNATIDAAQALFVIAIGTGFVVGILEIFGIIISLSLVCCITNSLKKEII